jgi:repressor LexA
MKLTKRQKDILDFITGFIGREGYSPSMEEIAEYFGISSLNAIYKHLEALQSRGYLHRDANRARSIELSRNAVSEVRALPLLGRIAAGRPIEAIETPETISIPEEFLGTREAHYILRVQGESMIDEHIADGDYVVVQSRREAMAGEMVVALVDGENVTLKRFFPEGSNVRLQPSNPAFSAMTIEARRVTIQGVVTGVLRRYRR